MAKDLNKCCFIGRLGKDVEIKQLTNGAVANFSIACSDDYKNKDGEKVEQTNWINIVAYGKLGEICGQYLTKGSQIYVEGKQVTRKWEDNEGNTRYSTDINIFDMIMLGGKGDAGQAPQQQSQPKQNLPSSDFDDKSDDIPF